jgi:hypothetical protein
VPLLSARHSEGMGNTAVNLTEGALT